jgi:2-polyprenyl-3-methyl-5-hydroxy-6-metoxy-1,4-benzoquinol methylase
MDTQNSNQLAEDRLTTPEFWDACYEGRQQTPFEDRNWRRYVSIQLVQLIESLQLDGKNICEVGGGDAALSAYLAKKHSSAKFSIVDFSPRGCELARNRAGSEGVELNIFQADLFSPPPELNKHFDLVMSHGVVEHFTDLASVMIAKSNLIREDGKLFTLIPNFASPVYARLCERWSKSVFDDHVPHDMASFIAGHKKAKLNPIDSGYLGAIEFGMLSMAMNGPERKTWLDNKLYLLLTRISKAVHFIEYKTANFPTTKFLSPFMYITSVKVI